MLLAMCASAAEGKGLDVAAAKATVQTYVRRYPPFDRSEQLALLTVRVHDCARVFL